MRNILPAEALPKDLAALPSKQAIALRRDYWDHDLELLTTQISPDAGLDTIANVNPLLRPIWPHIDDELRQIMVVAATLAQVENKTYVSTTNFVKALMVLKPGRISEFFNRLPIGALPDSVPEDVPKHLEALASLESFSPCINSAMSHLTPLVAREDKARARTCISISPDTDEASQPVFLRSKGVSKEDVEYIVNQLGWNLVSTASRPDSWGQIVGECCEIKVMHHRQSAPPPSSAITIQPAGGKLPMPLDRK